MTRTTTDTEESGATQSHTTHLFCAENVTRLFIFG